jgi:hypothetical protein
LFLRRRCWNVLTLGKSTPDKVAEESEEFVLWSNVFALGTLAEICRAEGTSESFTEAARLFRLLQQHDNIRVKYWMRKEEAAKQSAASSSQASARVV